MLLLLGMHDDVIGSDPVWFIIDHVTVKKKTDETCRDGAYDVITHAYPEVEALVITLSCQSEIDVLLYRGAPVDGAPPQVCVYLFI